MQGQRQGMKLSYLGSDAEELSEVLTRCIGPVRVQRPLKTDLSYSYEFAAAGRVAFSRVISRGTLSIGQKDEVPKLLILLPLHGSACVKIGRSENLISKPGEAAILDGNRLSELQIEGSRSHLSFVIDQEDIFQRLRGSLERPVYGSLDFTPQLDLAAGAGQIIFRLSQIMATCLGADGGMRDMPETLSHLSGSIVNLLVDTVPHRFSTALNQGEWLPSPRHVKRAVDFMHANLDRPLSMTEIAEAAGIGVRSLQEGFKRFKGTTPISYLAQLRLQAVHRDLLKAGQRVSVAEIARKWGFRHMGRFATEYRKCYGCPPSESLRGRPLHLDSGD
ncbi:AraC family transcriptional regulator [Sinorhizobium sp. FG01]|uniref:AraC family transcriptional regulator n=3 Tax=Sinorhizobium/Ensifer group TaxID=227292 RepID=A0A2S3YK07_9HYPH|nr:AraC family transcriptional regulator protein [Sinorhizobium fredii]PDT41472.1 AraC family transcriptional regulator [Sinorhizobium sp. FG01]POH27675.1 AraC family transcriptional regulator [Sinorhizobium americanum]